MAVGRNLMNFATYTAIVENGQVRLPPNVRIPENAIVYVVLPAETPNACVVSPRPADPKQIGDFVKTVVEEVGGP